MAQPEQARAAWHQQEWSTEALHAVQRIPRSVCLAFGLSLAVNFVCFFYELAQFPMGDHDVGFLSGVPLLSGGRAGRWFTPLLHILSGHVQVPVWTQLVAFCAQIAAGMGAVLLWRPRAGFLLLLAGGLLTSCLPNVTEFYYFHWMASAFPVAQLFMVLALHAAYSQPGETRAAVSRLRFVISVVLAVCGLATYQSCIMTWTVLFCGLCIMEILRTDSAAHETPASRVQRLIPPLCAFFFAGLLYGLSLKVYPLVGLSLDLYQFGTVAPSAFLANIPKVVQAAYTHLWLTQPFMGMGLKALLLLICLGGSAALLFRAGLRPRLGLLALAFLLLMPVAAKSQFFISSESDYYAFRFAAMGLNYIYLFFLLALLGSGALMARNAGFALSVLLLPAMIVSTLNEQVYLVRSNMHDFATLNRVMAQIEASPGFDSDKVYTIVQFGRTKAYMPQVYGARYASASGVTVFGKTVSQAWNPGFELRLLSSYLKLGVRLNEDNTNHPDLMQKALRFVDGKRPFPAQGSIGIVDDTIVLFFDAQAVETARSGLAP